MTTEFGPAELVGTQYTGLPLTGRLTADWGPRAPITDPDTGVKTGSFHNGIDIAAPHGTSILAPAPGVVDLVAYNPTGGGHWLRLRHPEAAPKHEYSVYLHMSTPPNKRGRLWQRGETVKRGDELGQVGSTGLSTGPHLHWGIWNGGGASVDPLTVIVDSVDTGSGVDEQVGTREILQAMTQAQAEEHFVYGLFDVLGHDGLYREEGGWKIMEVRWR